VYVLVFINYYLLLNSFTKMCRFRLGRKKVEYGVKCKYSYYLRFLLGLENIKRGTRKNKCNLIYD